LKIKIKIKIKHDVINKNNKNPLGISEKEMFALAAEEEKRSARNLVNKLKRSRIPKSVGGVVAIGGALLLGEASKKSGVADISKETLNAVGEATDFVFKSAFRIGTTVGDIASGDFEGAKKELSRISGYWDQTEAKISHNIDNMVAAWKEKDMSVSTFLSEEGKALKGYYKTAYNAIKNHDFKHDLNVIANETITTAYRLSRPVIKVFYY